ncbi:hypothetical protein CKAH01_17835 [Colletotrichum kahawae]|uniref:Uncharacterized protein n=1 Tax=Colletotrichum kahawae TaxID=34407 RepID=A0AAE0D2Z6_COLKA|nr:hypothetical protein CKAH01_17835 [Colletotrichum kahawae]
MEVHHRINDELLKLILTKLHRLENRFTDIDSRLSTIEFSIVPAPRSSTPITSSAASRRCSCHIPQPVFQSFQVDWERHATPSAYIASVDKLRHRFGLDEQSQYAPEDIGVASTCDSRSEMGGGDVFVNNYDNYSMSIYPSRPGSTCKFGYRVNDPRDLRDLRNLSFRDLRDLRDFREFRDLRDLRELRDLRQQFEVPELPSWRYEDMPIGEERINSTRPSSRRTSISSPYRTFSTRKSTSSTARTSMMSASTGRPSTSGSISKIKGSIKRARAASVPRQRHRPATRETYNTSANHTKDDLAIRQPRSAIQEQDPERFTGFVQKSAKACIFFVPNIISGLGKRMMNQQLKMLDTTA